MKRLCKLISDYMALLVLLAAVVAMVFPDTFNHVKPTIINPLLGIIMFGMGMTLHFDDFRVVFSRPRDVLIGCLAQFTVMPLLAWSLARLFALDEALTVGVVLVGCCPGGTASNVITYLAKGEIGRVGIDARPDDKTAVLALQLLFYCNWKLESTVAIKLTILYTND